MYGQRDSFVVVVVVIIFFRLLHFTFKQSRVILGALRVLFLHLPEASNRVTLSHYSGTNRGAVVASTQ